MSEQLKPAHQVIVARIANLAETITRVDKDICAGGVRINNGRTFVSAGMLTMARDQEIGGLCTLLEILLDIEWTPQEIVEILAELRKLTYQHAMIPTTIEKLEQRQGVASPV